MSESRSISWQRGTGHIGLCPESDGQDMLPAWSQRLLAVQEEEAEEGAAKDEDENGSEGKEGSEKGDEADSDDDADDEGSGDTASASPPWLLICNCPNWHSKAAVVRP